MPTLTSERNTRLRARQIQRFLALHSEEPQLNAELVTEEDQRLANLLEPDFTNKDSDAELDFEDAWRKSAASLRSMLNSFRKQARILEGASQGLPAEADEDGEEEEGDKLNVEISEEDVVPPPKQTLNQPAQPHPQALFTNSRQARFSKDPQLQERVARSDVKLRSPPRRVYPKPAPRSTTGSEVIESYMESKATFPWPELSSDDDEIFETPAKTHSRRAVDVETEDIVVGMERLEVPSQRQRDTCGNVHEQTPSKTRRYEFRHVHKHEDEYAARTPYSTLYSNPVFEMPLPARPSQTLYNRRLEKQPMYYEDRRVDPGPSRRQTQERVVKTEETEVEGSEGEVVDSILSRENMRLFWELRRVAKGRNRGAGC